MKNICVNINTFDSAEETTKLLEQIRSIKDVKNADWIKPQDREGERPYHNRFRNVAWVELAEDTNAYVVTDQIKNISGRIESAEIIHSEESYSFEQRESKTEDLKTRLNRLLVQAVYSCKHMMDANYPTPHSWSTPTYRKLDKTLTKLVGWFGVHLVILETRLEFKDEEYSHCTANFSTVVEDQAAKIARDLKKIVDAKFISIHTYSLEEIMELPYEWDFGRLGHSDTAGMREFKITTRVTFIPHRYEAVI